MKKSVAISFLLVCLLGFAAHAQSIQYRNFNSGQFASNNFQVSIKALSPLTNPVFWGTSPRFDTSSLPLYDSGSALGFLQLLSDGKFQITRNGSSLSNLVASLNGFGTNDTFYFLSGSTGVRMRTFGNTVTFVNLPDFDSIFTIGPSSMTASTNITFTANAYVTMNGTNLVTWIAGNGGGLTNLDGTKVNIATNTLGGTVVDFSKVVATTNMAGALTFTGISNFNGTNENVFVLHCLANGSDRTITPAASWLKTRSTFVVTNGGMADIVIKSQIGVYTNIAQTDYTP